MLLEPQAYAVSLLKITLTLPPPKVTLPSGVAGKDAAAEQQALEDRTVAVRRGLVCATERTIAEMVSASANFAWNRKRMGCLQY
jgi:hypothetical protein